MKKVTKVTTKVGQSARETQLQMATRLVQSLPEIISGDKGYEKITVQVELELSVITWFEIAAIAGRWGWKTQDVIALAVENSIPTLEEREAREEQAAVMYRARGQKPTNLALS